MSESKEITRREFTVLSALAMLGGATITVTGCGSGSPASPSETGGVSGAISANHGHVATITSAELGAGGSLSLNIQGSASHNHVVALTGDETVAIRGGTTVAIQSSDTNAHTHTVTFARRNPSSGSGY